MTPPDWNAPAERALRERHDLRIRACLVLLAAEQAVTLKEVS